MDDKTLRKHVLEELEYEPSVAATNIGVAVKDGAVTLTGHVPTFVMKSLAEKAVQRVRGVRAVVEEITVDWDGSNPYADDDIAQRALTVLDLNVLVPLGVVQVKVEKGWVTLTGEVDWDYQRSAAIDDLRKLKGVMGITNRIKLKPRATVADVKARIQEALKRNAELESKDIRVSVQGGEIKLEGFVRTWADRRSAEQAAWSAPGVSSVKDHLLVG